MLMERKILNWEALFFAFHMEKKSKAFQAAFATTNSAIIANFVIIIPRNLKYELASLFLRHFFLPSSAFFMNL